MSAADKNDTMKTSKQSVSCADFQDQLPDIFESGVALSEQEHLQTCEQCAALVRDLEYIAQQAKLLLPIHDPSPAVWDNIQTTLATQKNGSNSK